MSNQPQWQVKIKSGTIQKPPDVPAQPIKIQKKFKGAIVY
jgi:hypothetical protein